MGGRFLLGTCCARKGLGVDTTRLKSLLKRYLSSSPRLFNCSPPGEEESPIADLLQDLPSGADGLVPRSVRAARMPHSVLVVQPYIKWGPEKNLLTPPALMLEEAVSLVNTLRGWRVVGQKLAPMVSFDKKSFFSRGKLDEVLAAVRENEYISAVFVNTKNLKIDQHLFLEKYLDVPVYDRYTVIINIFKEHAVTKEAKLQVALAEVPYLLAKIRGISSEVPISSGKTGIGTGETYLQKRVYLLNQQERKMKNMIKDLRANRELLRKKRRNLQLPVVAVVGYTNAGKTSLIKCLTKEESLLPENKLFATLDITLHSGILPGNLNTLFIDTIGFISDIPTKLMEPFIATLEDIFYADVILHVADVSHPNFNAQYVHVIETLKSFNLKADIIDNIVHVGNKCDRGKAAEMPCDLHLISCSTGFGIDELKNKLCSAILRSTNLLELRMKVKSGGPEYSWLYKQSCVSKIEIDEEDSQYVYMDVIITKPLFYKFKQTFLHGKNS